jgi:hypothetical protein
MISNVVYEHVPKTGAVFLYQAEGLYMNSSPPSPSNEEGPFPIRVYRAGRTTKLHSPGSDLVDVVGKHMGGGLNRPCKVIVYLDVTDLEKGWDVFRDCLRRTRVYNRVGVPRLTHRYELGDNWYSSSASPEQLEKHLKEVLPKILNKWT